ncbi:hypothetical protein R3P38DRAFT_2527174 [Favolaschia claudopus]|uniref:Uncharacterized protein n=1 Tax=Favolaschia claudopus TaxID=2862362 RepID=A0AAW0BL22_9AGAR
MPGDKAIQISREQVLVLPNFAMTDYASQGKTRPWNVVDLHNCKDHASYYTALSRSATSAGTVIVQGMDPSKITKGIKGYLRQEFRELGILNEITAKLFDGSLVGHVDGVNRRELIASYRAHVVNIKETENEHLALLEYEPIDPGVHTSYRAHVVNIKETENEHLALLEYEPIDPGVHTGSWKLLGDDARKASKKTTSVKKRKPEESESKPKSKKKRRTGEKEQNCDSTEVTSRREPRGIRWDAENYSCAYDSIFTVLFGIWNDNGPRWSDRFGNISSPMKDLACAFERVATGTESLEGARDLIRAKLHALDNNRFPNGRVYTYLGNPLSALFGRRMWGVQKTKCLRCDKTYDERPGFSDLRTITNELGDAVNNCRYGVADWVRADKLRDSAYKCGVCGSGLVVVNTTMSAPPLMIFELATADIRISSKVQLLSNNQTVSYSLRGAVYSGGKHFTCRVIDSDGSVWYNDGIETGRRSLFEGLMSELPDDFLDTSRARDLVREVAVAIYGIDD